MKTLLLEGNDLFEIDINTFSSLTLLQTLQISNNLLTTIPQGIFDSLIDLKQLYSGENPWICNCNLQWFKEYLLSGSVIFDNTTTCHNNSEEDFEITDFGCPITTTTSEATTTIAKEETITVSCRNLHLSPIFISDKVRRTHFQTVSVKNQTVSLNIFDLNTIPPSFEIEVYGSLKKYHMFWRNVNNLSDYGCMSHIHKYVVMENLRRADPYTLCVILTGQTVASPFDCVGFTVPPEWNYRTWISNKMIGVVLGGTSIILVVAVAITALAVFYCVRQNPKLLAGNKRIVIVGNRTVEAMVMPKRYTKPSSANYSSSYLTPNNDIFEKRRQMLRSMSECSVFSTPGSYITTEVQADIHQFYSRQGAVRRYFQNVDETIAVDEHIYERPPVPPDHPTEMSGNRL